MTEYPLKSRKYIIHLSLKYLRGTGDPKCNLLKQNHPNGVIKVVSSLESSASGICQNPLLASSLLIIVAPDNCASVVSTLVIGCTSRKTLSLRGFRSKQIRTAPVSLEITTIATHQGVGPSTGEMTPKLRIHCKFACTFVLNGRGMFLGVCNHILLSKFT